MDTPDNGAGDAASRSTYGSTRYTIAIVVAAIPILYYLSSALFWAICHVVGSLLGHSLRRQTEGRKLRILEVMRDDQAEYERNNKKKGGSKNVDDEDESLVLSAAGAAGYNKDWDGIVGFFHPFCNAGGGGERVLWAAIRATQLRWPNAKCIVYTGDHEVTKEDILHRVRVRFNIKLHAPTLTFLYLSTRRFVLASTWPHFTLAGQSLGSIILSWDAFSLMVPDIFVDTMGYAFSLAFSKMLFPNMPTGAYVHYPTISTDMLESLDPNSKNGAQGVNAGQGIGIRGKAKQYYWQQFANWYSACGSSVDVVMTNSTWTQSHISKLWDEHRRLAHKPNPIAVVYPPVAVRELEQEVEVSKSTESVREKVILYIAQFRPEKNHQLILQAFAEFIKRGSSAAEGAKLVLVGSVRDDHDSKRVYKLRLLVNELHIKDQVEFHLDAPWPDILKWLRRASVGVNGMWNEHFGIGVVEYQAAGLVAVVHNSGGPKLDIVTEVDGKPTGFHASTATEFAAGFEEALSLKDPHEWRVRARQSAKRFTEEEFVKKWLNQMEKLVAMKS